MKKIIVSIVLASSMVLKADEPSSLFLENLYNFAKRSCTLLNLAVQAKDRIFLNYLLEEGFVECPVKEKKRILQRVLVEDDVELMKPLLKMAHELYTDNDLIYEAAKASAFSIVKSLIETSEDKDIINNTFNGGKEEHKTILLTLLGKIHLTSRNNITRVRARETVKMLLEKGVSIHELTERGKTPLHLAADCGEKDLVKLLLDKGADINAQDNKGYTALEQAITTYVYEESHVIAEYYKEVIKLLLEHGAQVDKNLLEFSIYRNHSEMLTLLLPYTDFASINMSELIDYANIWEHNDAITILNEYAQQKDKGDSSLNGCLLEDINKKNREKEL